MRYEDKRKLLVVVCGSIIAVLTPRREALQEGEGIERAALAIDPAVAEGRVHGGVVGDGGDGGGFFC